MSAAVPTSESGMVITGNQHRPPGSERQVDHEHDDDDRLDQREDYLLGSRY